jgi:cell division protein FtsI/penicillin-binding protein 2
VERYNPEGVSVIVSRPNDGSILALANYPTFDLNEFFNTKLYPIANQRNRAITDTFEPGSTFKIVPASGVLNESEVDPEDIFETGNEVALYKNRKLRLPSDHHFYDRLSMAEIVIKSSNRGAAHLGMILGEDRLHAYAESFGFGERTDLGLRGEISGTLHPINRWDGLTITRMPMGHAVDGTPMQIHYAMSVIANKGLLMKPRIIDRITNTEDILLFEYPAITKRRVLSEFVSVKMADLLHEVVGVKGTAKRAAIKGYSVGGKTGTTQKIINGKYSSESHVASFSGFLPVEDPQVVITVVVDAPKVKGGIGYGGVVAAPVFKEIAENCIRYLEIRSSEYSNEWFATRKAGQ